MSRPFVHPRGSHRALIESLENRQLLASVPSPWGNNTPYPTVTVPPLSSPAQPIGTVSLPGVDVAATPTGHTTHLGNGDFDVTAGGMQIDDYADSFHFSALQKTGDFDVRVRIASFTTLAGVTNSKAGLMARESLSAGSRNVFAGATSNNVYRYSYRSSNNGNSSNSFKGGTPNYSSGVWLRLVRSGNNFTGYYSSNGSSWTQMYKQKVSMPSTIYVGLATSSRSSTQTVSAQYRQLTGLGNFSVPQQPLATPTGLELEAVSDSQIEIGWSPVNGATQYRIQRKGPGEADFTDLATTTSTTYSDTNLADSSTYFYRVRAEKGSLVSDYGIPRSETTDAAAPQAPDVPQAPHAAASSTSQINLSWSGPADGPTLYRIERKGPGETQFSEIGTTHDVQFTDSGLQTGATYEYRVRAEKSGVQSGYSSTVLATTFTGNFLAAPANLTAQAAASPLRVNLNWSAVASATLYRVYRKGAGENNDAFVEIGTSATTSFADTTVAANEAYDYRVRAERDGGLTFSDFSQPATANIPAAPLNGVAINTSVNGNITPVVGGYNVVAGGDDIWNKSDSFFFAHQQRTGDFDVMVKIDSFDAPSSTAKAGLMVRETLSAGSKNIFAGASEGDGYRFHQRSSTNGDSKHIEKGPAANFDSGVYVRLQRVGNKFTAYRSTDGTAWVQLGSVTMTLPQTIYLGLANSSKSSTPANISYREFKDVPASTTVNWTSGPAAPIALQESAAIQIGNKLYQWGGYASGLIGVSGGRVLDLDTGAWSDIASLPAGAGQTHAGIATDGNYVYLVAGQIGNGGSTNIISTAWRYDIVNNTWSSFTSLPQARGGGALVYLDGSLHYFGGFTNDRITISEKHWSINVDANGLPTGGWVEKSPLINPGDHLGAVVMNGKIYAVGGEHSHGVDYIQHNALSEYNPLTDIWTSKAPMPFGSSHFEAGVHVVQGRIVVLGGEIDGETLTSAIRAWDPITNTWSFIGTLPKALKGGASAWHNDELLYTQGNGIESNGGKAYQSKTYVGTVLNPWW